MMLALLSIFVMAGTLALGALIYFANMMSDAPAGPTVSYLPVAIGSVMSAVLMLMWVWLP